LKIPGTIQILGDNSITFPDVPVKEARYSLTTLRAVGVGLLSNHEGMLFAAMDGATEEQVIVFVHPTNPMLTASDGLDLCQH